MGANCDDPKLRNYWGSGVREFESSGTGFESRPFLMLAVIFDLAQSGATINDIYRLTGI